MKKNIQQDDTLKDDSLRKDEKSICEDEKKESDVWKEKYFRALADYQNLEKRTRDEYQEIRMHAGGSVIEKILPVVDLLEKADQHVRDEGLSLAVKELSARLHSLGVERQETVGKQFDPESMECVEVKEGDDGIVLSEFTPGYRMHGKLIRPAKVTVGRKLENSEIENGK